MIFTRFVRSGFLGQVPATYRRVRSTYHLVCTGGIWVGDGTKNLTKSFWLFLGESEREVHVCRIEPLTRTQTQSQRAREQFAKSARFLQEKKTVSLAHQSSMLRSICALVLAYLQNE